MFWRRNGYDLAEAQELCEAIGSYDKLRLVVSDRNDPSKVHGLVEFSFGIPENDLQRFRGYGIQLVESTDCRFGPCLRDELHGTGLAHAFMPPVREIARLFGKSRILLWGGVLLSNTRATSFYEKNGFHRVGEFVNNDGQLSLDMVSTWLLPSPSTVARALSTE